MIKLSEKSNVNVYKARAKILQEKLRVSVESCGGRLERVVKAKGGYIEI